MQKKLQLLLLLACLSIGAMAQFKVEGEVKDADGQPLVGASILVKGKTGGVSTNAGGKYSITVPDKNATLVVSFLGYESREIPVKGQAVLNIELTREESQLRSVVVTALGIKRQKSSLGYAVSEVAAKDIVGFGETNPMASIAGKLAGVSITGTTAGPTGSIRVIIRGIRELGGSSQPLYVIDGVPAVNSNLGSANQNGGFDLGDGVSDINPNDIETISVLKGASAAALYGNRALNGVVLITTKSGRGKKGLGIEFSSTTTIDKVSTKLDEVQKIYGQGNNGLVQRTPTEAGNITASWGPKYTDLDSIVQRDGKMRPYKYLENNVQGFFRSGVTVLNTISVTGGNERSNMRASYSNTSARDIAPKSDFSRNNFSFRGETKITDQLTVEAKGALMVENVSNRPALTDDVNNIGNGLLAIAGNFDQAWLQDYENPDGSYINYTGNAYRANPYWTLNKTTNESRRQRVGASLRATYKFSDRLSASVNAGTDFFNFKFENFYDKFTPSRDGGLLSLQDMKVKEDNYQAMINYNTPINKDFKIGVMAGGNLMKSNVENTVTEGKEIIVPGRNLISNFTQVRVLPNSPRKEIQSLFGSAEVNFRDYLYLNLQARNDWSSALPKDNRSYFYPSVDLSMILTNAFDIKSDVLNYAKVRGSVGQVGSDTDPFKTAFLYSLTGTSIGGYPMGEVLGTNVPNPRLKPQRKTSIEIGTDIGFFNDRVAIDFTYYKETTNDAILDLPIPGSSGFETATLNAAKLTNSGVELLLKTTPIRSANGFRWDLSFNYSKNVNKVVDLYEDLKVYPIAEARWAGVTIVAEKGKAFGIIKGNDFVYNDKGQRVHGSDGLPLFTDAPVDIGNSMPDWTGGLTNSVSYKGFEFKAVLDIRVGGDMFSITNLTMYQQGAHPATVAGRDSWNQYSKERRAAEDAGQNPDNVLQNGRGYIGEGVNEAGAPNTKAVNPSAYWGRIGNNIPKPFIYDGGYVKLRDVGINYTLPKSLFKRLPVQSITVGIIGRNLWVIQKSTPNIDPESNYNNGNGQGFEYGSLPGRKRYGFNVLIKL